ncbi:MAG: FumA C-terminus/TtdB family hydratase beta subunit [Methanotrichaceae archaeon]|nr:FumA C-terminus/TtdB family hydratase beta subunit [Methanotrichaceae archaeon]
MEFKLRTPLMAEDIENLRVRDIVFLNGKVYTARDKVHALIGKKGSPISLEGAVIYHCGPLIKEDFVLSAGPTTSDRLSRYTDEILNLGVRAIIGKGGLPGEPFKGRAAYLAYPGGCGAAAARQMRVSSVYLSELGMAEALWEFQVKDFGPLIVGIDSHGNDLYRDVRQKTQLRLRT